MVFANISIQGWIVDPDVKSLFYCPLEVLFHIFSDLRKPGLVPGESLSLSTNINSVLEKNQIYKKEIT